LEAEYRLSMDRAGKLSTEVNRLREKISRKRESIDKVREESEGRMRRHVRVMGGIRKEGEEIHER
jgi:predicted  nucleic acid-binding Zn-ribbon protein